MVLLLILVHNGSLSEYIIVFRKYMWASEHRSFLRSILNSHTNKVYNGLNARISDGMYEVIDRNNPSTRLYQTDFALIRVQVRIHFPVSNIELNTYAQLTHY